MDQNPDKNNVNVLSRNKAVEMQRQIEAAEEVILSFEVDNGMRIKNPLSQTEMPTCYVYMKPNF